MKVLFVMRHSGYVRNFESTLRVLCERGHSVHLAFQFAGGHWPASIDVTRDLTEQFPRFSVGLAPMREDAWGFAARDLRLSLDYLRYLAPEYRGATKLRGRAERAAPEAFVRRAGSGLFRTAPGRALLEATLRARHAAIPTDPRIDAFLQARRPHVLAITPLIEPGAPQAEYVRSARALGIRSALCVASWDNLTNKGLIHGDVDLVAVWNTMMKREAVTLHGVPAERVVVTGAQPFDHWFGWSAATTREEFCARVGLPADRPFILYLCSSKFIAPTEAPFVRSWIEQLRQTTAPALRDAGILIRPHPQNAEQWQSADVSGLGAVAVWPRGGEVPVNAGSRANYFDSIHHSAAVVGINTTAEIESAIVGRPVFTLLAPEFRETQEGTLHFDHLRRVGGGLLHVAGDMSEHLRQLEQALGAPGESERAAQFVADFVRPHGLDVPATPRLVEALEGLARQPAAAVERVATLAPLLRAGLLQEGARLQREALEGEERKAAKRMRRQLRHTASGAPAPATGILAPDRSWKSLAAEYRALDPADRRRFQRSTAEPGGTEPAAEAAQGERLDYPDAEILLRVTSKAERNRLRACAKEPFTVDWIHRSVRAGDVFYDIGANVGAYSLIAARKPGGAARVFAFEPSYANVAALCANIVLNRAGDDITPMPFALSNVNRLTVFALRALEPGSARHSLGDVASPDEPPAYRQPVMTFALDELIERFGLPMPNHIKLDVDGGELEVLAGAARALASPTLRSMLVEVSTSLSEPVTAELGRQGLHLESKIHVRNKAGEYLVWYGLFTREPETSPLARDVQVQYVSR